jgi:hypothetical protein
MGGSPKRADLAKGIGEALLATGGGCLLKMTRLDPPELSEAPTADARSRA